MSHNHRTQLDRKKIGTVESTSTREIHTLPYLVFLKLEVMQLDEPFVSHSSFPIRTMNFVSPCSKSTFRPQISVMIGYTRAYDSVLNTFNQDIEECHSLPKADQRGQWV